MNKKLLCSDGLLCAVVFASCASTHKISVLPSEEHTRASKTQPQHPQTTSEPEKTELVVPHDTGTTEPPAAGVASSIATSVEMFPGVRVNRESRYVEFDGVVAIDAHNIRRGVRVPPKPSHKHMGISPNVPIVYLECIACTTGTKEHESIVSTSVLPSHIHAALLMIGAESGAPGTFRWEGRDIFPVHPTGDTIEILVVLPDGRMFDARELVVDVRSGVKLREADPATSWVFAGSKFVEHQGREVYASDGTGVIVGLATFGTELAGYARTFSHESDAETPVWIANAELVPVVGAEVQVRIGLPNRR